jgi:tetratricopeptide (TPR) repeat protein
LDDALEDCNRALQLEPERDTALYARGFVYFRDEKFDLALADLNAAIAKDAKYARALYLRGVVRRRLRDEAGAAADIAAALALKPQLDEEFKRIDVRS